MTTKHTPGPFILDAMYNNDGTQTHELIIRESTGMVVGYISYADRAGFDEEAHERGKADARLFEASPEMLTALKEARGWVALCEDLCKDVDEPLAMIDAAIAKAEGGKVDGS
ncbi:MAG: hypothetical protein KAJ19_13140 [Gammaproteobacteria bacterium]|nr:hypothetical protein [Gammaproteobacteria bacterium]